MKPKLCVFLLTAVTTLSFAQSPCPIVSGTVQKTSSPNADGTSTVTTQSPKGEIVEKTIVNADGSSVRSTKILFDSKGQCVGWKSSNAKGQVDSGEIYSADPTTKDVTGVISVDGTVLYKK